MAISLPLIKTEPLLGLKILPAIVKKVLLPEPEGPKIKTNSPLSAEKLISLRAWTLAEPLPKYLLTFLNSITDIKSTSDRLGWIDPQDRSDWDQGT